MKTGPLTWWLLAWWWVIPTKLLGLGPGRSSALTLWTPSNRNEGRDHASQWVIHGTWRAVWMDPPTTFAKTAAAQKPHEFYHPRLPSRFAVDFPGPRSPKGLHIWPPGSGGKGVREEPVKRAERKSVLPLLFCGDRPFAATSPRSACLLGSASTPLAVWALSPQPSFKHRSCSPGIEQTVFYFYRPTWPSPKAEASWGFDTNPAGYFSYLSHASSGVVPFWTE